MDPIKVIGDVCGRCAGSGVIGFYNEVSQQMDEASCPICGGTGTGEYFETPGTRHGVSLPVDRSFADGVSVARATRRSRRS